MSEWIYCLRISFFVWEIIQVKPYILGFATENQRLVSFYIHMVSKPSVSYFRSRFTYRQQVFSSFS